MTRSTRPIFACFFLSGATGLVYQVVWLRLLGLVFGQALGGSLSPSNHDPLAAGAIYWDFVDVVWLLLFTTFYLLTPR